MSNRPKKWPDYALGSLEGTLMHLKTIEGLAKDLHRLGQISGQMDLAGMGLDVRSEALNAIDLLRQARTGEYT